MNRFQHTRAAQLLEDCTKLLNLCRSMKAPHSEAERALMNRYQHARAAQLLEDGTMWQPDNPGARRARQHLIDLLIYPNSYSDTEARDMITMAETHLKGTYNDKV